jgi:hypothetical protein
MFLLKPRLEYLYNRRINFIKPERFFDKPRQFLPYLLFTQVIPELRQAAADHIGIIADLLLCP